MNPYQYYSPQLTQQEPYYSQHEYNPYPQQYYYDHYQTERQPPAIERIVEELERQNEQQSRELT
ncbi:hypothetical protein MMJ17_23145, partial [Bacillus spizizenii]|nr:hypothetical protein [Bacillus spizizenii]